MEINPNRSLNRIQQSKLKGKRAKSASSGSAGPATEGAAGAVSLGSLEEELKALPETRSEKIKEGTVLARDPHYPDKDELKNMGRLVLENELRINAGEG